MSAEQAAAVDQVIRARRTDKVLADEALSPVSARGVMDELVAVAGWAPFHKPAARVHLQDGGLTSIVPWRFHLLDAHGCRALRQALLARGDRSKVPRMLAAASALVQATWLPNPPKGEVDGPFEATVDNMEIIAAAGAAVQNLLLAATSRGIRNYWASGGALRDPDAFRWMGIPEREILLGSVFFFPADTGDAEVSAGSHRDRRGAPAEWSRWVDLALPGAGG
jgi:nitroreductase